MGFTIDTLKDFKIYLKKKGKLNSTIICYSTDIKEFIKFIQENKIAAQSIDIMMIENFKSYLIYESKVCPNSLRRKIISLKQFYRFLCEEKNFNTNILDYAIIPSRNEQLPDQLDHTDIDVLTEATLSQKSSIKAARDHAIINLLALEGIKISELIALKWSDFLLLREISSLRIKGQRHRILNLHPESTHSLKTLKKHCLEIYRTQNTSVEQKEIFCAFKGRELHIPRGKISRHGLKFLLYELGEKCDLKHINAELLRHYCIKLQIDQGKSAEDIMEHLGLKQRGNITKHFRNSKKELVEP